MFMDKAGGPLGLRNAKEKQLKGKVFNKSHGGSADGSEDEGINPVNGRPKRVINPKKKLSSSELQLSKLEPPCGDFIAGLS
jgi:hypothetical protein